MLTDRQLGELCTKMKVPLERICFKDQLKDEPLKYNRSYIINLHDELNGDGEQNEGSHWVALQVQKTKNGKEMPMYMDSYGMPPPKDVLDYVGMYVPYNTKDVQSLMADYCGWFCCAWLHYINAYSDRSGFIYQDTEQFLEHFEDLNESCDFKKNEYILKLFFQSSDPSLRKPIDVGIDPNDISKDGAGIVIPTALGAKL